MQYANTNDHDFYGLESVRIGCGDTNLLNELPLWARFDLSIYAFHNNIKFWRALSCDKE
jgi:hypothetical protein